MWVIAEQENGQLMNVTFELLGAAKELCAKLEEKCCAVLVTAAAGELPQQLIAAGADVVYVVEDAKYADYDTELYTDAICQLSKKYDPASIMFGATDDGRDLAPRVAARLHTGLCADCTALDVTVPHKQAVMKYLVEIDQTAADIGAVNTLVRVEGGAGGRCDPDSDRRQNFAGAFPNK